MRRPTIMDIAREAGVSKGSVSYALNGLPGVSETTRSRILSIAADLGWHPNSAARALSGARSQAVGLLLARPAPTLGVESFFMQLISGIEAELSRHSVALMLQVTGDSDTELSAYRRWWGERRVDGVLVTDLRLDDPRVALLEELGMPAVVIGGPGHHGNLSAVWTNDAAAIDSVLEYLAALGHRRIARVAGRSEFLHTITRDSAYQAAIDRLGLGDGGTIATDYSAEQGARATRSLLSTKPAPTAIVFDNDVMAVAGIGVAHEMGLTVPRDLSVVAGDDSPLCQHVHPPITAVFRDVIAVGERAAKSLLEQLDGPAAGEIRAQDPWLIPRGSTAPPAH
ncbi:MAG TPA: LacI family DNA-binding transcriptional regulator [Mycobacteriales bacterium]|jgi:DNA-binding LacI/PurR family transcriptional regulator|nr:LacI family DNA-binding transcriptional regulator [Mycobacteriales bacterium]